MVRIALFILLAALSGCEAIDFTGFVTSPGDNVDRRFSQSMSYMSQHGITHLTAAGDSYSFYLCTDVHVNGSTDNIRLFMDTLRRDPDAPFGLILGDVIDSRGMMTLFADALRFDPQSQPSPTPVFVTLGNHDTFYSQWDDFRAFFGASAYYFEVSRGPFTDIFIALDSAGGTLGTRQSRWLRDLLGSRRSLYDRCFVFTHTNFFKTDNSQGASGNMPLDETLALTALFDENDVTAVFQGHDHYREELTFRGVRYITAGTIEDGARNPEYLRVTVTPDSAEYEFRRL